MKFETLLLERSDAIARVTINRPEKLNALSHQVFADLDACFHELAADDDLRAVILTGAGDKAFVAGADIAELAEQDPPGGHRTSRYGQAVMNRIEAMSVPVIAAVHGFALGGGCELALSCHVRLAHANARFGQPEVNLGLIPGYGGTQRLTRLIGMGRATELCISARMVDAQEALAIGLVSRVHECWQRNEAGEPLSDAKGRPLPDLTAFLDQVENWARGLLDKAPLAIAGCIEAVRRGASLPLGAALELEQDLFSACFSTADMREGTAAFLEKRKAAFRGR
ncbi:MAG: enoyl-CoA hydratase/isomerase family protein [Candidatus Delongbacteria bacterium]|nr:enoyl-CoA hydratase/isomerase family protein [Candidatus Cloacimonadota bacterium]MCB9473088.1 enoyl-CoA hydratase/isomerase family protein [Candidatus Delongbacteria bacterium]